MSDRESFGIGLQKSSVPSQPSMHNMRLTFNSDGTAVYKPVTGSSPGYLSGGSGSEGPATPVVQHGLNMAEPMKRKRGRPRKYGPDGTMALALTPVSPAAPPLSGGNSGGLSSPTSPSLMMKKARGRPPGSGSKKQMVAFAQFILRKWLAGSAGVGFTPHVITVKAGEDVSSKIMSFSQHGPRAICILSANGAISNVTLRQAATSGGTVTYEGRFEILSLSGSFLLSESGGQRSRTGGLSVSLAGPDGRVLGGGVAGLLTAASPVQVVVGSFIADAGHKQSKPMNPLGSSALPKMNPAGAAGTSSPPSRGTLSESSGGPGSPLNQSAGAFNNSTPHGILTNIPWK